MTIAFAKAVNEAEPGRDLIVVFDWAEMRRVRYPRNSNNWHDLGAGIDLDAYERRQVPADTIVTVDGLAFAVKIDEHTLAQSRQRLIDVDVSAGPRQIVLR
jgi:hypothetical protein